MRCAFAAHFNHWPAPRLFAILQPRPRRLALQGLDWQAKTRPGPARRFLALCKGAALDSDHPV